MQDGVIGEERGATTTRSDISVILHRVGLLPAGHVENSLGAHPSRRRTPLRGVTSAGFGFVRAFSGGATAGGVPPRCSSVRHRWGRAW